MTSNIEAIIFDFDGVFIDSFKTIHKAYNHFFKKTGRKTIECFEEFKQVMSVDFKATYKTLCLETEQQQKEASFLVQEYLDQNYLQCPVYSNMIEFVKTLPQKMGIASSGTEELIKKKLDQVALLENMASVIGRDNVSNLKPDPEPVLKCAMELGISTDKAMFVGDTYVDMRAGKAAKVAKVIGVDWGFEGLDKLLPENPDGIISQPIELLNYLM